MKIQVWIVGLAVLFNACLCVAANSSKPIYTENQLSITVTADSPEFIIKLKSNPTTGYSWSLRDYEKKLIIPVKHGFQKPIKQLIGAPGFELWTFRVKPNGFNGAHQTVIRFVYARPWESHDASTPLTFKIMTISVPSKSHSQKPILPVD